MEEMLPVTVTILDKPYKLRIERTREAALRRAAELIDKQARAYAKTFAFQDRQDLLAMVALTQITDLFQHQDNLQFKDSELERQLQEIDTTLEQHLHPIQNSL